MERVVNIVSAEPVGEFVIHLQFDDGTRQKVDFLPFLQKSRHPQLRKFLDPARFADFRLEHGELVWGEYELCFPQIDLYNNRIEQGSSLAAVA